MKIAIITINKDGERLAGRLKANVKDTEIFNCRMNRNGALKNLAARIFNKYDGIIFIAAMGIVVRLVGPLLRNKFTDPAVVAVDTASRFAISALSGHEGGANDLTYLVASAVGALPVITTGCEVHKKYVIGIGSRRGISAEKVKSAIRNALRKNRIGLKEIRIAATVDLKKGEVGLVEACRELSLALVFIPKENIRDFKSPSISRIVRRNLGLEGVCEPAALLAGRRARLIQKKKSQDGVTIAIAREN